MSKSGNGRGVGPGGGRPGDGDAARQAGQASTPPAASGNTGTPPQQREGSVTTAKEGEPGSRTWLYNQLGMAAGAKDAPADAPPADEPEEPKRGMPKLDFDALRPGDPNESPFPPGSLGGGVDDPEPRKFQGFPKPGSGLPTVVESGSGLPAAVVEPGSNALPPNAASGRPANRAPDPAPEENPFRIYDERTATGDIALPSHPAPAKSERKARPQLPLDAEKLSADSLTADNVLKKRKPPATKGWRKGLMATTGINLGPSRKELADQHFEDRVRTPIDGCHRLAVISLKGGVGKTTTAATLGSMFASLRGDRVIAIDANPDRGTLGDKIVPNMTRATVRDFVRRSPQLDRYSAVREFTAQAPSRLEVLCSESDPLASMAFSEADYRVISDILERFYNLVLTDCGTGLLHSAMVGVLAKADQVVIVSSASLDGARSASATLDWLEAHNYSDLARESVTVVTSVRPKADAVHLDEIVSHFAKRTRAVVAVPYDPHLAEGGQIDLERMSKTAYHAYLELAAEVGDAFARTSSPKG
jgi:MinD-like ATPase involved in chromosome partitioning or flagellar assembly